MNLKEWFDNSIRDVWSDIIPVFKIDDENPAEEIIKELERLGFFKGNMCAEIQNTEYIDVWFKDFYNTFHIYTEHECSFFATLAELKEM